MHTSTQSWFSAVLQILTKKDFHAIAFKRQKKLPHKLNIVPLIKNLMCQQQHSHRDGRKSRTLLYINFVHDLYKSCPFNDYLTLQIYTHPNYITTTAKKMYSGFYYSHKLGTNFCHTLLQLIFALITSIDIQAILV